MALSGSAKLPSPVSGQDHFGGETDRQGRWLVHCYVKAVRWSLFDMILPREIMRHACQECHECHVWRPFTFGSRHLSVLVFILGCNCRLSIIFLIGLIGYHPHHFLGNSPHPLFGRITDLSRLSRCKPALPAASCHSSPLQLIARRRNRGEPLLLGCKAGLMVPR